jgi:hypothetical protein
MHDYCHRYRSAQKLASMKKAQSSKEDATVRILFTSQSSENKEFQRLRFDEYTVIESRIKGISDPEDKGRNK